ncbi:rho GDP-dissociation inhibitor 1-like isoform X1 [Amaranthus tricolor]|uniref:rho GDP-dissociation inhibitor 1-like isoform X1 n=1 Tax=Amaranthus tricolor TaxID=29722 RepID=UPI002584254C|nr:rho GDP-dissociation inhibitor 1-like isoform X1 [Amaranthus tricolor]
MDEKVAGSSSSVAGDELETETENVKQFEEDEPVEESTKDGSFAEFVVAPLVPLQHHLEKDKDDESLRRWKEKLLGSVEGNLTDQVEPEVTFHSIGIISDDLEEKSTALPLDESESSKVLFSFKEDSRYRLKLIFTVKHNIVSGLAYSINVWKAGIQVDQRDGMLGTFAPQQEPYVHLLEEETTPSGALARGVYAAKLRFADDDKKCHMELSYSFEIKKNT